MPVLDFSFKLVKAGLRLSSLLEIAQKSSIVVRFFFNKTPSIGWIEGLGQMNRKHQMKVTSHLRIVKLLLRPCGTSLRDVGNILDIKF